MAEQAKTGAPIRTAAKKKAPAYELVIDESGVMQRVPVKAQSFRPAIATAAVAAAVKPEEENLVFDESGELVGTEKTKALEAAKVPLQIAEEDELVFTNEGQVTGEEAKAVIAEVKTKERKTRKPKGVDEFSKADDLQKMKTFYRLREKNPSFFTYTAEGNLEIRANNPAKYPPGIIPMRAFSALRPEELEEIDRRKEEEQAKVESDYVLKMKELREAYDAFRFNPQNQELAKEVVRLNMEMRELSVLRNSILYPERWIANEENPTVKTILLEMTHEDRKMGYDVFLFKRYGMSRQDAEGHYREHGEGTYTASGGSTVVLFLTSAEDPTTGIFHPAYEEEFVFNETKYVSPYQAFETERFKELEDEAMVKKLLGTRSAKTIKQLVSQDHRPPQNSEVLWQDILEAFYNQKKDLAEKLKETGSARFHMMDKQIGTPEYANTLVAVRTKLKERGDDAPSGGDIVKQSVITKEEQAKAKVGAIINTFRRNH